MENAIPNLTADLLYEVPLMLEKAGLAQVVVKHLGLECHAPDLTEWDTMVQRAKHPKGEVEVALVGKYVALHDAYLSVVEALTHGGIENGVKVHIRWVDSEAVTEGNVEMLLAGVDGVLVPGGFGSRGIEGKISAIRYAREHKIPFLGICLGLQLLFAGSEECQGAAGLGILPGRILKIPEHPGLKIPHMGWNSLKIRPEAKLFRGIEDGSYVYFVHSYYLKAEDESIVAASTEYSTVIHASVERENVFACQFHPEKSGEVGLAILKNFIGL